MATLNCPGLAPASILISTPSSPPPRGPIARLPLELLVYILNCLLGQHSQLWDRQTASQAFLRVCRAFRAAHQLSDAAHECGLAFASQADLLIQGLEAGTMSVHRVQRVWVELDYVDNDGVVARLVRACGPGLRSFVWRPRPTLLPTSCEFAPELVAAWAGCPKTEVFLLQGDMRSTTAGEVKRLFASWDGLRRLNFGPNIIDHDRAPLATKPPNLWSVPTKLWSLTTDLYDETFTLVIAIVQASARTLKHLTIDFHYGPHLEEITERLPPVTAALDSLVVRNNRWADSGVEWDVLAVFLRQTPHARSLTVPFDFITIELGDDPSIRNAQLAGRTGLEELVFSRAGLLECTADLVEVVEPLAEAGLKRLRFPRKDWESWEKLDREDDAEWECIGQAEVCEAVLWANGVAFELVD